MCTMIRTIILLKNKVDLLKCYLSANVYGNLNSTMEKWFRDGCQYIIYQSMNFMQFKNQL